MVKVMEVKTFQSLQELSHERIVSLNIVEQAQIESNIYFIIDKIGTHRKIRCISHDSYLVRVGYFAILRLTMYFLHEYH